MRWSSFVCVFSALPASPSGSSYFAKKAVWWWRKLLLNDISGWWWYNCGYFSVGMLHEDACCPSAVVSGKCGITWAATFWRNLLCSSSEELITIWVVNDTITVTHSRVLSKLHSALTRGSWMFKKLHRRKECCWEGYSLSVTPLAVKQHSCMLQYPGLGICYEGQTTDYPSCLLWLVKIWWMAGRWAKELL